jgi:DNA-binding NtrC family response regulator
VADILLVDDDEDMRALLADLLKSVGHTVRTAENGAAGLRLLNEPLPQVVISDVEMPVLNGPAMLYRMFIEDLGRENIPFILISGSPGLVGIAAAAGTPYYLRKPFDFARLEEVVQQALAGGLPPRPHFAGKLEGTDF